MSKWQTMGVRMAVFTVGAGLLGFADGAASGVGDTNVQTVWRMNAIADKLSGADASARAQELFPQYAGFFSPHLDCAQTAFEKRWDFDLKDVPLEKCIAVSTQLWSDVHTIEVKLQDVWAADKAGRAVTARVHFEASWPGTASKSFFLFNTYYFNEAGKINGYLTEMVLPSVLPLEAAGRVGLVASPYIRAPGLLQGIFLAAVFAGAVISTACAAKRRGRDAKPLLDVYSAM